MNTSYFNKYDGPDAVAISRTVPEGYNGERALYLAPPKWLLDYYKHKLPPKDWLIRKDIHTIIKNKPLEEAFEICYRHYILHKLDPRQVWEDLKDKTLVCWEGSDKFCHRHLVANWLIARLGVNIEEVM